MTLNPQFQQIGETFVKQYYLIFDGDRDAREKIVNFYHADMSLMSFEGSQVQGAAMILEKVKALSFQKIQRAITTLDCQPTFDGGVLVNILGQLKMDDDPPHGFNQTFVLKPLGDSFFVQHDMFRLAIHNTVMDEDPVHGFAQTFVLKPLNDSFYIQHDSFRLVIHNA